MNNFLPIKKNKNRFYFLTNILIFYNPLFKLFVRVILLLILKYLKLKIIVFNYSILIIRLLLIQILC